MSYYIKKQQSKPKNPDCVTISTSIPAVTLPLHIGGHRPRNNWDKVAVQTSQGKSTDSLI